MYKNKPNEAERQEKTRELEKKLVKELWPLLVTEDDRLRTVQIGLKQLRATNIDQLNVTFAGTILAFIPLVILLLIFQKQLVRGLTAGAVKG